MHPLRFEPRDIARGELVERGFKIIKDDWVGQQLKDESQFPKWVDPNGDAAAKGSGYSTYVDNGEYDRQDHGNYHNSEARRYANQLPDAKVIARVDVVKETARGKYPPGIAIR